MDGKKSSREIGLEIGLALGRWLTGAGNLHYGDWTGLEVCAANLGVAQENYTRRLFRQLPRRRGMSILDIGGGAGETAKKLLALGHSVDIVVPSPLLASECRKVAPEAIVHMARFEDFTTDRRYDLCLFSESFQYIDMGFALDHARSLLSPKGQILICDCFRTKEGARETDESKVGGGHPVWVFRSMLEDRGFKILHEEDITLAVAPSVEIDQGLHHVVGKGFYSVYGTFGPIRQWLVRALFRVFLSARRRRRLWQRFFGDTRNRDLFATYNRYLLVRLKG